MARLIDADKAKIKYVHLLEDDEVGKVRKLECMEFIQHIDEQPTADPVKHAHWKWNETCEDYLCSSCGHMVGRMIDVPIEIEEEFITGQKGKKVTGWALRPPYYCQYCGSKMDEEVHDNE